MEINGKNLQTDMTTPENLALSARMNSVVILEWCLLGKEDNLGLFYLTGPL